MTYTFAVDWDGTLVEGLWPEMGDWLPGAIAALHKLDTMGTVVIHTCRVAPFEIDNKTWRDSKVTSEAVREVHAMLEAEGLGHIEVWVRPYKPPALVYIDDRAIRFTGNWNRVLADVELSLRRAAYSTDVIGGMVE
jgi:hypothetical protein